MNGISGLLLSLLVLVLGALIGWSYVAYIDASHTPVVPTQPPVISPTEDPTMNPVTDPAEDVTLTGFKFHQTGMMRYPSLSIRQTSDGYEAAATYDEIYWPEIDTPAGEDFFEYYSYLIYNEDGHYGYDEFVSGGDPFDPEHSAGTYTAKLTQDDMDNFFMLLNDAGVLEWDGFNGYWTPPAGMEVSDSGCTFDLKLLLSDGRVITAHGMDSYPNGYDEGMQVIYDFFESFGLSAF